MKIGQWYNNGFKNTDKAFQALKMYRKNYVKSFTDINMAKYQFKLYAHFMRFTFKLV